MNDYRPPSRFTEALYLVAGIAGVIIIFWMCYLGHASGYW